MSDSHENRRNFHRIFFDAPVTLTSGETTYQTNLSDLSLNGALVKRPEAWQPQAGQIITLAVSLDNDEIIISMEAEVSHVEDSRVGLRKVNIDMDSITHLRRLVELNLGDSNMLHRDLEHLVDPEA